MFRRLGRRATDRPVAAVALVTALALAARLVALGARPIHWDEARVAFWTVRYLQTGTFVYRPIIHGPFYPVVTAPLFDLLGPTDAVARLVPAVLGGLLPPLALLFRDGGGGGRPHHPGVRGLDDAETVALAAVLAVQPLLLHFSRFARSDLPLAFFALAAFGLGFRAVHTGRARYLLPAGLAVGVMLTTKENALVYLACFAGAAAVAVLTPAVATPGLSWADRRARLGASLRSAAGRLARFIPTGLAGVLLALPVVVFFYAPRGSAGSPSLSAALAGEATWPALVARATLGTWAVFADSLWASGGHGTPLEYLGRLSFYLLVAASPVLVASVVGVWSERRSSGPGSPPRALVVATAAWALASLLGYPLGTDIAAPWLDVHVVLPLTIPAAVGAAAVLRWPDWGADLPDPTAAFVTLLLVVTALQVGLVAGFTTYAAPTEYNFVAQAAQSADDMDPFAETVAAAAGEGGVLYYGDHFYLPNETVDDVPPAPGEPWLGWWVRRLPMAWYVARVDAGTTYARFPEDVRALETVPPVVVAHGEEAEAVAPLLEGYDRRTYDTLLTDGGEVVVFVDESRLDRREG